jgi:nucleoside-diphosphate-sugar epimerase
VRDRRHRFVGAHVARALAERGDDVRVIYRNPARLRALNGLPYRRTKADVLDYRAMRRALRGAEVLFHVAGYVASSPIEHVWQLNARGPDIAVQAAAAEGVRRVVLTSTISAIGAANGRPADESTSYPEDWLIESGAFDGSGSSGLSRWADSMQMASRLGLLAPVRVGQRIVGRKLVAGG